MEMDVYVYVALTGVRRDLHSILLYKNKLKAWRITLESWRLPWNINSHPGAIKAHPGCLSFTQ